LLRPLLFGLVAASAVLGSAEASAAPPAGPTLIKAISAAQLQALPASMGHALVAQADGTTGDVKARSGDGQEYSLRGALCDDGGATNCRVIVVQAWIDHAPVPVEKLNAANLNIAAVSTVYDPDQGMLRVVRLIILDGGISSANLRENVTAMLNSVPAVLKAIEE